MCKYNLVNLYFYMNMMQLELWQKLAPCCVVLLRCLLPQDLCITLSQQIQLVYQLCCHC
ncbi:MAG: hypothetical protein CM15mP103_08570 [Gammaproteobacteria bacterium]|nr:MAG: hypothetical protein CM15mP103_08570 [Gammaproteobacteria bacterium]